MACWLLLLLLGNDCSKVLTSNQIPLSALYGRSLSVNLDKDFLINRSMKAIGGKSLLIKEHQYLVRVHPQHRNEIHAKLKLHSKFLHYFPHDTFIIIMRDTVSLSVESLKGIDDIFSAPPELKIHRDLRLGPVNDHQQKVSMDSFKLGRDSVKCHPAVIHALLAECATSNDIRSLCNLTLGRCKIMLEESGRHLLVDTDLCNIKQVALQFATHHSVLWIQERGHLTLRNKYATRIVQSADGAVRPLWEKGLTGDGEIIGITDTGVDYESCFFSDPRVPLPKCVGFGAVQTVGCINYDHRKIVTYRYFPNTNVGDAYEGHGTHVSGSVLGDPIYSSKDIFAAEYSGVAKNAKLAFDDVSIDGENLLVPTDLNSSVFPHPYMAGARIHSLSWGNQNTNYDGLAMQVDTFMYDHDDYLVIVSAGNDGPNTTTVGSPATAKNVLAVGTSENSLAALADYGDLSPALETISSSIDENYARLSLQPAAFGPHILLESANIRGTVVAADPIDGCSAMTRETTSGNIALVRRGGCLFGSKILNAQRAGAIAALVYNNVSDTNLIVMSGRHYDPLVQIPSAFLSLEDGNTLLDLIGNVSQSSSLQQQLNIVFPVQLQDTMNILANISSRGPSSDGRVKPDVVCPGISIRSVKAAPPGQVLPCNGSSIMEKSGTSMATAVCAGSAALVRQYFREGFHIDGVRNLSQGFNATSALIKAVMIHSGKRILTGYYPGPLGTPLPDMSQGYGRVDLASTLWFGNESGFNMNVWNKEIISNGETRYFCVHVLSCTAIFRVSLVWTDPPALPSASKALVNDINLIVIDPRGQFYYGNAQTQWSPSYGLNPVVDTLNNAEQVTILSPFLGIYVIKIVGSDIPVEPQSFAMVVTGNFSLESTCDISPACPQDCSGHGICDGGNCDCAITFSGLDCSLQNAMLQSGEPYEISFFPQGWAYYLLRLPRPDSLWTLDLLVQQGDPEFFLAYNRIPTERDYDMVNRSGGPEVKFECTLPRLAEFETQLGGTWVLGVSSSCCKTISVIADLNSSPACASGYLSNDFLCRNCSTSPCATGDFRSPCTFQGKGICRSCTTAPANASHTSAGFPYDEDNCNWECNVGTFKSAASCEMCSAVPCPAGQYRSPCKTSSDGICLACPKKLKPKNAVYVSAPRVQNNIDDCVWECQPGFRNFNGSCINCSITLGPCLTFNSSFTSLPLPGSRIHLNSSSSSTAAWSYNFTTSAVHPSVFETPAHFNFSFDRRP